LSIKEPQVEVTPQESRCRRCGHPELHSVARSSGESRLWFAYCPACHNVQDRAAIPEWFLEGLPPPPNRTDLH
jgi:Zn finger protein HypA/HybF involved in hydrogenase expression